MRSLTILLTMCLSVAGSVAAAEKRLPATPSAAPVRLSKTDLAGEWTMYLPAGFEHKITLEQVEEGLYRLSPGKLNSSGLYAVKDDRLVGVLPTEPDAPRFQWTIRSPHMLILAEQPARLGSNYSGAILFRPAPAPVLRSEESPQAKDEDPQPRTTLDELDALVKAGNYHLVRRQKIGHRLASEGVVRALGAGHPDWVLVDLPGEFWSAHLRNLRVDHGLQPGDRIAFDGLIVEEAYSALTVWVTESKSPPAEDKSRLER